MKRLLYILIALLTISLPSTAQQRKTTKKKAKTTTTSSKKKTSKKKKDTATKQVSIKGLQREQANIKKNIKEQERKLRSNERDVKQRLQNLMVINTEIEDKRKTIDTIRRDITKISGDIHVLNDQLENLQGELADRKMKYIKSMRYMHRNRSIQNQLMFIFSAKNFSQMYRRLRFVREYAAYQRAQGEAVKLKQKQVTTLFFVLHEASMATANAPTSSDLRSFFWFHNFFIYLFCLKNNFLLGKMMFFEYK